MEEWCKILRGLSRGAYRWENSSLMGLLNFNLRYTFIIGDVTMPSELNDMDNNYHMVIDCGKEIIKDHCYWPVVSDLINVLSHKPIAFKFIADQRLLNFWFNLVSLFQGPV